MDLVSAEKLMLEAIHFLDVEFSRMQVGRANTAMVEGVLVEAYGQSQPLRNLATISTPDARTILISPWDKSIVGSIEKEIRNRKDLGFNPVNQGAVLLIPIPQPTGERRQELAKVAKQKGEQAKISIRNARAKLHAEINDELKNKKLSEDQAHLQQKHLQEIVDKNNKIVEDKVKVKEKEILTV